MAQVLEGHLREHLGAEDRTPQERREDLDQVLSVLRSYLKKVEAAGVAAAPIHARNHWQII